MKATLILLCFIIGFAIANYFRNKRKTNILIESRFEVSYNDTCISVCDPNRVISSILINKLKKIDILTTEDGPWSPDVFWRFFTEEEKAELIFPSGATGESDLLKYFQDNFEGFNSDAVIEAMGSTRLATFELWKKT